MKKIVFLLAFSALSIFLFTNIQAQNVLCIGTITSISMTDFGAKHPSFQTKWSEYLQTRTWKWASGHVTFAQNYVRIYVKYLPSDELQELNYSVEKIDLKKDETGRNAITLTLKSTINNNFFPAFLLFDDKDWIFTITGTATIVTWKGTVL